MQMIKKISNIRLKIDGSVFSTSFGKYYIFHIQHLARQFPSSQVITIENQDDYKESLNVLFSSNTYIGPIRASLESMQKSQLPFWLSGEQGTELRAIAQYHHLNTSFASSPFITIHCEFLQERRWESFISSTNSPIHGSGCTLFFEDIDKLGAWEQNVVISYLQNTQAHLRHQIIFSSSENLHSLMLSNKLCKAFYQSSLSRVVHVPPLRERREDLPTLAMLYLLHFNATVGKRIVGFEPQAMELLCGYEWPLNLIQFGAMISQLVRECTGFYITAEEISNALCQLEPCDTSGNKLMLDLNKPLSEIEKDIIQIVLREEQQNQSATAKRLEISRSTLWRKMQS